MGAGSDYVADGKQHRVEDHLGSVLETLSVVAEIEHERERKRAEEHQRELERERLRWEEEKRIRRFDAQLTVWLRATNARFAAIRCFFAVNNWCFGHPRDLL